MSKVDPANYYTSTYSECEKRVQLIYAIYVNATMSVVQHKKCFAPVSLHSPDVASMQTLHTHDGCQSILTSRRRFKQTKFIRNLFNILHQQNIILFTSKHVLFCLTFHVTLQFILYFQSATCRTPRDLVAKHRQFHSFTGLLMAIARPQH